MSTLMSTEQVECSVTREEIETMCVLHAASSGSCRAGELAGRLGLSSELGPAVLESILPLISAGWLRQHDDCVILSDQGREWLDGRLKELGIARD